MMPYSKIKEIAKELCNKSPCHHKCCDTNECVVEDDAQLLINENKSNNFEVKSNKQIEEMANDLYENRPYSDLWEEDAQDIAKVLYNAGYRKQSEGEWIWTENGNADYEKYWVCSNCKEHDFVKSEFCPYCGAKMKGGEE